MKITGTNITIMVSNMDTSIKFYEMLGFTIKQRWENNYCMMSTTDLTIGIHPGKDGMAPSEQISIGLFVEDINEVKKLLADNNVVYDYHDADEGIYVNFKDPDGATLYYSQPRWN
ncbi:MAG: VOC family protein [Chitinophagales bacterium]